MADCSLQEPKSLSWADWGRQFFCEPKNVGLIADWQEEEEKLSPNHSPPHNRIHQKKKAKKKQNPQTLSRKADSESQQESAIRDPCSRIVERTIKQEKSKQKQFRGSQQQSGWKSMCEAD